MKLTDTEIQILNALKDCRYLPGSFEKKFSRELDPEHVSPLQQWNLHRLCVKYRKQIGNDILLVLSRSFMARNPKAPLARRESERLAKKALKSKPDLPLQQSLIPDA